MASAEMCECSDSESPSSNANTGKSKQEIQEELAVECEKTWQHIQDMHHRLASHRENKPLTGTDKSNATLKILQHKEKRMEAELEVIKNQNIKVISKDLPFVETLLLDNMKKNITQLQATLAIVKSQRQEVALDIAVEGEILEKQKAIQSTLEEKLAACGKFEDDEQSQNSILAELQAKKKDVVKYYPTVMNQLGKFLSDHFPPPDDSDVNNKEDDSRHRKKYCTLQHIIETLMNRLFESPHDCYVKILPTYWPPYIQLLLRSSIIQRHPDNCELVRLVAFHT